MPLQWFILMRMECHLDLTGQGLLLLMYVSFIEFLFCHWSCTETMLIVIVRFLQWGCSFQRFWFLMCILHHRAPG